MESVTNVEEDTRLEVSEFQAAAEADDDVDPTSRPNFEIMESETTEENALISFRSGKYLLVTTISLGLSLFDVGSDIFLAYNYFTIGKYDYFGATVAFVGLPAVMLSLVTSRMLSALKEENVPLWKRNLRFVLLAFQISPIIWYVECIYYAIAIRRCSPDLRDGERKSLIMRLTRVDMNLALTAALETALEALPQLVLQITILLIDDKEISDRLSPFKRIYRYVNLFISFASAVWAIASYDRSRQFARLYPVNMSWVETIMMVLHMMPFLISRILVISRAAAVHAVGTLCVCFVHWCVSTPLLRYYSVPSYENGQTGVKFWRPAIMGFVWIFYPFQNFDVDEPPSYGFYFLYYPLTFLENLALTLVLIIMYDQFLLPIVVMSGFFLGLIARWVYILLFPPFRDEAGEWAFI